ncbi:MAG: sugar transferase [Clostridiales bacterium]|jgi:lipopolysaccharide/colanic/teichoic acid biosynthesis glycosyltransferase|nr:sugar transferase [Clostridiales bacterium]
MSLVEIDEDIPITYSVNIQHAPEAVVLENRAVEQPEFVFLEKPMYDFAKRLFDIVCSLAALIVLSPLFLAVSILIRIDAGGPLIYSQQRVGKGGRLIKVHKFRTMKVNADKLEDMLTPEQLTEYKKDFKLDNDPRVTCVGKILRMTSLDEIPQFWDVLLGRMSIIGPRPVLMEETFLFEPYRDMLLNVKPGISGFWQVNGRSGVTYENFSRQTLELYYITHRSLLLDLKILFKTFGALARKTGAK